MRRVMRSVLRSYAHWFNGKYERHNAPVFERPFAARRIGNKRQGIRTLNYVHLSHENERESYEFCSHDYYIGARAAPWIDTDSGLWFHDGSVERYLDSLFGEGIGALEDKIAARRSSARHKIPRGRPSHIAKPLEQANRQIEQTDTSPATVWHHHAVLDSNRKPKGVRRGRSRHTWTD